MKKIIIICVMLVMITAAMMYFTNVKATNATEDFFEFYSNVTYEEEETNNGLGGRITMYVNDPENHAISYETDSYEDEFIEVSVYRDGVLQENKTVSKTEEDEFEYYMEDILFNIFKGEL